MAHALSTAQRVRRRCWYWSPLKWSRAKAGLGYPIIYGQHGFLIAQMYFGIPAITRIGLICNALPERI
jgi:hypothetical protein